jgi:hypothetical protein
MQELIWRIVIWGFRDWFTARERKEDSLRLESFMFLTMKMIMEGIIHDKLGFWEKVNIWVSTFMRRERECVYWVEEGKGNSDFSPLHGLVIIFHFPSFTILPLHSILKYRCILFTYYIFLHKNNLQLPKLILFYLIIGFPNKHYYG